MSTALSERIWNLLLSNANTFAPKADYNDILIKSAHSLCTRYSPVTGTIKSWNSWRSWNDGTVFNYPVIIDNMMNLELLFFASRISGDDSFRNVAVSHAEKTMKNQMRKDGSFYHITMYDPDTGKFIKGETNANYVLMHSTGAIPQNSEIDVPLVYADYYFVEALHRYNKLLNNQPLF